MVDVDVHVAPQTVEPLLAHMEPYWADYVANAELRLSPTMNGLYPPVAFLAGEEEGTRPAASPRRSTSCAPAWATTGWPC